MGPNIKYLVGEYWDFWDHYLPLIEKSLSEGLINRGFEISECVGKFLPYTMVDQRPFPGFFSSSIFVCRSPGGFSESNFWLSLASQNEVSDVARRRASLPGKQNKAGFFHNRMKAVLLEPFR
jgi:hypothetical protein